MNLRRVASGIVGALVALAGMFVERSSAEAPEGLPKIDGARVDSGSRMEADFDKLQLPWLQRTLGAPFRERAAGKPWEKEATAFVNDALENWEPASIYETRHDLARRSEEIERGGCDDPLVQWLAARLRYRTSYAWHWHRRGIADMMGVRRSEPIRAAEEMTKAWERMKKAGACVAVQRLILLEVAAAWVSANANEQDTKRAREANALLAAALRDGSYRLPDEEELLVGHLMRPPGFRWVPLMPTDFADDLDQQPLSEWARECIRGCVDYAQGYVFAKTAPEHWDASRRRAFGRWEAAWKLRPERPEPAFAILNWSWSIGAPGGVSPMVWFERVTSAQFDFDPAYQTLRTNLRPDWYGSEELLLGFGRQCAATKRFDSAVPLVLVDALKRIAGTSSWRNVFRDRANAAALVAMARGMAEAPSRQPQATLWHSLFAVWAWAAGDDAAAAGALASLPEGRLHPAALNELRDFGVTFDDMKAEISVRLSPAKADLERAQLQMRESELPAAREFFTAALTLAPADALVRAWLQRQLALVDFEEAFARGGWVPVPTDLAVWEVIAGKWANAPDGALLLTGDGQPAHIRFRGRTGVNLEFRGEYEAADHAAESGKLELGIAFRCRLDHNFEQFSTWGRDARQLNAGLREGFFNVRKGKARPVDIPDVRAPLAPINSFHLRTDARLSSLTLNGENVYRDVQNLNLARESLKGQASVGFAARALASDYKILIRKLEVRRLPNPPKLEKPEEAPAPEEDSKPKIKRVFWPAIPSTPVEQRAGGT